VQSHCYLSHTRSGSYRSVCCYCRSVTSRATKARSNASTNGYVCKVVLSSRTCTNGIVNLPQLLNATENRRIDSGDNTFASMGQINNLDARDAYAGRQCTILCDQNVQRVVTTLTVDSVTNVQGSV